MVEEMVLYVLKSQKCARHQESIFTNLCVPLYKHRHQVVFSMLRMDVIVLVSFAENVYEQGRADH